MKSALAALLLLCLTAPAFAGTGGAQGVCVQDGFSNASAQDTLDPYSYLLPSDLNTTSFELSNSYQIELKPLRADDMSQYQFNTVDNRGLGAGYSSPYMWEAGRGPGGSGMGPTRPWGTPQMDGRAFSPIPMPASR